MIRHALTVDVESWFHAENMRPAAPVSAWPQLPSRLNEPMDALLEALERRGVRGTFFILGEVAGFYPELVKEIAGRGHEIGCHGFHHVDIDLLGEPGFRDELSRSQQALTELAGKPVIGYRAPNLLLRDFMIPVLRDLGFRYDASVCTSRSLLGKDFGHQHRAQNPYRFRDRFSRPEPGGDLVEIPLPTFPLLRLPAATGILTRVLGRWWTVIGLRHALATGDAQYYFHPYEMGPKPKIPLSLRQQVFLRHLGPWTEQAVEAILGRLRGWGVRFVTAGELARAMVDN